MTEKRFSMKEAIQFGWETFKANVAFFVPLLIVVLVIYIILGYLIDATRDNMLPLSIVFQIVQAAVQLIIGMGILKIGLKFVNGEKGEFGDLFTCLPLFLNFLAGSILYGLITFVGTLLLIVPGIIWGIQFQYFRYFIVDKGQGPIEALKSSAQITKGAKWELFLFSLLLGVINLAGLIALLLGLFITIPIAIVADAFVYKKLAAILDQGAQGNSAFGGPEITPQA